MTMIPTCEVCTAKNCQSTPVEEVIDHGHDTETRERVIELRCHGESQIVRLSQTTMMAGNLVDGNIAFKEDKGCHGNPDAEHP